MENKIAKLRKEVIQAASNPQFLHHQWFMKWHLNIVLDISLELNQLYPESNKELIEVIVWLHDYGKILDFDNQEDMLFNNGKKLLETLGFEAKFIEKVMEYLKIFESKMELDLSESPIEVKIVSSADAASHFFGPFFFLWWYENPNKDFEDLMKDNENKAHKDWNKKIVLPEAKKLIENRYKFLLEQAGNLPERYLSD